jgi:hypothetical protein
MLAVGSTIAVEHLECHAVPGRKKDKRKRLYITERDGTALFYCQHCGYSGSILLSRKQRREAKAMPTRGKACSLPKDFIQLQDAPKEAIEMVTQWGITIQDAKSYGIGYSKALNRLILPCYREGELAYYQARLLSGIGPNNSSTASAKYLSYGNKGEGYMWNKNGSGTLVIVEDMLSAIKLATLGVDSLALLTTSISKVLLATILAYKYCEYVVWLDADNTGVKRKGRELQRELGLLAQVSLIELTDPKRISNYELKEILGLD